MHIAENHRINTAKGLKNQRLKALCLELGRRSRGGQEGLNPKKRESQEQLVVWMVRAGGGKENLKMNKGWLRERKQPGCGEREILKKVQLGKNYQKTTATKKKGVRFHSRASISSPGNLENKDGGEKFRHRSEG